MQAYGERFAKAYDLRWSSFSVSVAPRLREFFESEAQTIGLQRSLLDVCCGTGQVANQFLESGFEVAGVDMSPYMIERATENNRAYVDQGRASFRTLAARCFDFGRTFSFAVCTFDALNHLESMDDLRACFARVHDHLLPGGSFIFDLNTRKGLQRWNGISVEDTEEWTIITRGVYAPGMDRAYTQITGFYPEPDGTYQRFTETVYNTVFDMEAVRKTACEIGLDATCCASAASLDTPAEELSRAFFVCRRG